MKRRIPIETLLSLVSEQTGISEEHIKGKTRPLDISTARHVFCWLAVNYSTESTVSGIGRFLNRDHTTIIHSRRMVEDAIKYSDEIILTNLLPLQLKIMNMDKTVNEMILALQDAKIITEEHSLAIQKTIDAEKTAYAIEYFKENASK
jgi:hypothetical protein